MNLSTSKSETAPIYAPDGALGESISKPLQMFDE